ncbi:sensor histidine kinase [Streptacidiphilus sp. P02-A3a]|uniref:sensor histidine kinase n=1 Tax=Streptacidiphilus sp. P02-A3a TaxID=2704468 RepID=UPI0015F7EEDD|nr:histidine kinase [Streptacidiphilus sp. P02-A3a]QMU71123.1 sensor histidine kinase [Streptacidiphilus sp. P02-A3a]
MLTTAVWLTRPVGFAVVGAVTFLNPPRGPHALLVTVVGYCLLGVGLTLWGLLELYPPAMRRRERDLPLVLGLVAVVAGFAAAPDGGGECLVAFAAVAVMSAGSDLGPTAALAVATSGILAIEIGGVVYSQGFGTLLGFPLLLVLGLLMGRNRGAYRVQAEQSAALLAQYERLQAEQRRADVLDERTRIAREIHDVLAHSLGALGIQIQAARAVLVDQGDVDRAVEVLATAQRLAADGLVETRRAVHALRVDTLPLDEELAHAVDIHGRRYGAAVSFATGGVPRQLPPDATVALLRTAQEALINAAKHAGGQRIAVRLDFGADQVRLTVVNDLAPGRAHRPASASGVDGGYGLTGMHERLLLIDGTLTAGPRGDRWTVTAELPLAPGPAAGSAAHRPRSRSRSRSRSRPDEETR